MHVIKLIFRFVGTRVETDVRTHLSLGYPIGFSAYITEQFSNDNVLFERVCCVIENVWRSSAPNLELFLSQMVLNRLLHCLTLIVSIRRCSDGLYVPFHLVDEQCSHVE